MRYQDVSIGHNFQRLRSFMRQPHLQYRPLIICDTGHDKLGLREFLTSPFFNIEILGKEGNRLNIHHEFSDELSSLDFLGDREELISAFADAGYIPPQDHVDYQRKFNSCSGIIETVKTSSAVRIHFSDFRGEDDFTSDELAAFAREEDAVNLFLQSNIFSLMQRHEEIFGRKFAGPNDKFAEVLFAILTEDNSRKAHHYADGKLAEAARQDPRAVIVIGSAHTNSTLKEDVDGCYGAQILEISYWMDITQMMSKIYMCKPCGPTYSIRSDEIKYPSEFDLPLAKKEAFLQEVRQAYAAWKMKNVHDPTDLTELPEPNPLRGG